MNIRNEIALVTGANRGMGHSFVTELRSRGIKKIYAAARRPETLPAIPGVVPLMLDVTDDASVARAVAAAGDTTLLVNNAGVSTFARLTDGAEEDIRLEMETNFFGTLRMVRAFAPVLGANGGGAVLNVLSVMAWMAYEHSNSYGASKAATWALTNGIRYELAGQGTQVTALAMASVDTDMMASIEDEKSAPEVIAKAAVDGLEAGSLEVLADGRTAQWKSRLGEDPALLYPQLSAQDAGKP
ncbi:SDR family oxidoreductase [Streptomyces sp. ME02-6987-2C]|uniref:SDR family oxidoreductase n=1 Tax=unclassified Streptomyces TaxID=2593676 RepID=UPI0029B2A8DF|nr:MULTISPECIES: SDR family oxidoreductase [unclassified Streptomyces]MDX3368789.1 SDR family oxidoreductase [Streptomyces sp. ME02-6987-2C]MDX3426227.1 SDR family oxidoreductase [Streptomyces sp. ME02-6985-2c]